MEFPRDILLSESTTNLEFTLIELKVQIEKVWTEIDGLFNYHVPHVWK